MVYLSICQTNIAIWTLEMNPTTRFYRANIFNIDKKWICTMRQWF